MAGDEEEASPSDDKYEDNSEESEEDGNEEGDEILGSSKPTGPKGIKSKGLISTPRTKPQTGKNSLMIKPASRVSSGKISRLAPIASGSTEPEPKKKRGRPVGSTKAPPTVYT